VVTVFTKPMGTAVSGAPNVPVVFFTAGEEGAWVIRDIIAANYSATPETLYVALFTGSGGFALLHQAGVEPNTSVHLDLRQALAPGDQVALQTTGAAGTATCVMTGYNFAS